ncbi:MAG TPA: hypothetical protein VJJ26_03760 [Candidatus Babeliales bacterium]|nr:hypothetical protein [Candidatus Babeliales bacterium]
MKNTSKKSILSRVALLASLIMVTGAYAHNTDNEKAVINLDKFIRAIEGNMSKFFNSCNKTGYNIFVIEFEKIFQGFKRTIEPATRGTGDGLTKELYGIIDYALQQFNIAYNIIKKYNGKSSSDALAFSTEIKRDFNTEKIFGEIITKLKALRTKAIEANETVLADKIQLIVNEIEQKKKAWSVKPDYVLFAGLKVRMDCK